MLTMTEKDRAIHTAVLQELRWDTQVDEMDVGVEVDRGVVTLTGTVRNYAKKMAAQEAAHRVIGVLDVANDIRVHVPNGEAHTDTEIAQAIRRALEWDVLIDHEKINTTVTGGWVTLEGTVVYWTERDYAERAVRNLGGVRGVTNNLIISTPQMATEAVCAAIETALERRAEREAQRIKVEVKDGAVTLTGRVHNWNEKEAVLGAAGHAPGVRRIEDCLSVQPYF